VLLDSYDQWRLTRHDLDFWEGYWKSRPPTRVVACLTTIPSRLPYLELTFKSLLAQSWAISKIRLHIPPYSQRENCPYQVPDHWRRRPWLEIVECQDYGPATKLIPALQDLAADQRVLVVDDDMVYPASLVQNLLRRAEAHPGQVIASSGWVVPDDLVDRPTTLKDNLLMRAPVPVKSTRIESPYQVDILQGYSGYLAEVGFFDLEKILDYSQAPDAARWVDDVWLSAHCRVPKFVHPAPRYCFERWEARAMMKAGSLGRLNRGQGGDPLTRNNTIAIRHLQAHWLNFAKQVGQTQNRTPAFS
jgi:hypothetical protein